MDKKCKTQQGVLSARCPAIWKKWQGHNTVIRIGKTYGNTLKHRQGDTKIQVSLGRGDERKHTNEVSTLAL